MSTKKAAGKSTGNGLKDTINSTLKRNPLQYNGSFVKEDADLKDYLKSIPDFSTSRPEMWFESFIGQVIYATKQGGFSGMVEVVDKKHALKLHGLQMDGYNFFTVSSIAHRIAGEVKGDKENNRDIDDQPHVNQVTEDQLQEHAHAACVKSLIELIKIKHYGSDRGDEILDELYFFFGKESWQDNMLYYRHFSIELMTALSNPVIYDKLVELMGNKYDVFEAAQMLKKLQSLCTAMMDSYMLDFELFELTRYNKAKSESAENWLRLSDRYQKDIEALLIKRG